MSRLSARRPPLRRFPGSEMDHSAVLNALSDPVIVIDQNDLLSYANLAAEQFLSASFATLIGRPLAGLLPADSPLFGLIDQVRERGSSVSEAGVTIETPRIGAHFVSIDVAVIAEIPGSVVISLKERSIARKIEHQLVHRNAARSVTAMAAMLAHEVKNPLSGIRGAAQLLEASVEQSDRELTQLICDEADRIVSLVDRMEMFSDNRPLDREAVNIHEVLGHVRRLAASGFARHVRFEESYDPSLPPVYGKRDLLIQVLINLVKNAAEAAPSEDAEILLATRYQRGVRLTVPGSDAPVDLPLLVTVQDNGAGIPEELRAHLFDAFVSGKPNGKGLGLALAAKIVGDHGGIIEFVSEPRRTIFRLMLPKAI